MGICQGVRGDSSSITVRDLNLNSQCRHVQILIEMTWGRAVEIGIRFKAFFNRFGLLEFGGEVTPKKELSDL